MIISKTKQFFLTNLALLVMITHLNASDSAAVDIADNFNNDERKSAVSNAQNNNPNALASDNLNESAPDNVLVRYQVHNWNVLPNGNVEALLELQMPVITYRHSAEDQIAAPAAGNNNCMKDLKTGAEAVSTVIAIGSAGHALVTLGVGGTCTTLAGVGGAGTCAALMCRLL